MYNLVSALWVNSWWLFIQEPNIVIHRWPIKWRGHKATNLTNQFNGTQFLKNMYYLTLFSQPVLCCIFPASYIIQPWSASVSWSVQQHVLKTEKVESLIQQIPCHIWTQGFVTAFPAHQHLKITRYIAFRSWSFPSSTFLYTYDVEICVQECWNYLKIPVQNTK